MKYLGLIAGTLILGVGLTALQMSGGEPLASTLTRLVTVNAKALAALGCFVAMFQFAPKDYQRRAWALLGLGAALLAEADMAAVLLGPAASPGAVAVTRGIIVAVANVATPLGMIMFARALEVAGLDLAGSRKSRLAFYVAAVVVALVFAGPSAVRDLRAVVGGDIERLHQVASDVGDIVALALVAPLIYNVVTLRGGTLLWPFVMLAASTVSWLCYDGVELVGLWVGQGPTAVAFKQGCRLWALMFLFVAGLSQRWALAHHPQPVAGVREARAAAA